MNDKYIDMDNFRPPAWMNSLVDVVFGCIEAHNPMGPLGFRFRKEEDIWEIVVYPTPVELTGGVMDGTVVSPGFSMDLQQLSSAFDCVDETHWCAHGFGPHDPEGPHISIEGIYQGHNISLQVLAEAPDDEEPGIKLDTSGQQLRLVPDN